MKLCSIWESIVDFLFDLCCECRWKWFVDIDEFVQLSSHRIDHWQEIEFDLWWKQIWCISYIDEDLQTIQFHWSLNDICLEHLNVWLNYPKKQQTNLDEFFLLLCLMFRELIPFQQTSLFYSQNKSSVCVFFFFYNWHFLFHSVNSTWRCVLSSNISPIIARKRSNYWEERVFQSTSNRRNKVLQLEHRFQ